MSLDPDLFNMLRVNVINCYENNVIQILNALKIFLTLLMQLPVYFSGQNYLGFS